MLRVGFGLIVGVSLAACATSPTTESVDSALPLARSSKSVGEDEVIAAMVSKMRVEHKVAQLIQPHINSFNAEDMERYRFGSYLNGGDGGPYGDEFAPASEWLRLADEMYEASVKPLPNGEPVIPTMWGTDAVHGHANIVGATIFPHNIGLGATGDTDLLRRIGQATAEEIEATGIDWNFSPTVAVARDDRWGRTYESYSEDPNLVARLGSALVTGLQGTPGSEDYLGDGHVIATAKHFFGDGGTAQGIDTGDVDGDLEELEKIHALPYPAAIDAGVQVVMASFNSINGVKMHGNKPLLTDLLRGEMGFDGIVVGDWNGHGQIKGCTVTNCPQALKAGLDIYMVPEDWKLLLENLVAQVNEGTIPMAILDRAVTRILRVKLRAGLFASDAKKPSERGVGGNLSMVGSPEHRLLAREAVAKSQVILKNDGVLPIKSGAKILVAGAGADSIWKAAGGWTLTWQGGPELTNDYFPGATSIWAGIEAAASASGGTAILSSDGSYANKPDVAIVVFGEGSYAEFYGDLKNLVFRDDEGLKLLRKFRSEGVPTVAVFLSGRPMWMNREINAADAFVASWLPGSEGAGVADILFGKRRASGRLSFSWPADCGGAPINSADGALFPVGFGNSLSDNAALPQLGEECGYLEQGSATVWYAMGRLSDRITASAGSTKLFDLRGDGGGINSKAVDRERQGDARDITFAASAALTIEQQGEGEGSYVIQYNIDEIPNGPVRVTIGDTTLDVTRNLALGAGKGWREMIITAKCAPALGNSIKFESDALLTLSISRIERQKMPEGTDCSF